MLIYYNNNLTEIPGDEITLAELLKINNVPDKGVAVAYNNRLVRPEDWESTIVKKHDDVVVVGQAYGG